MAQDEQRLTVNDVFMEAQALSQHRTPVKLRNAGRSLCDAFKLFLSELGGPIYGYDFVSNLDPKIRFEFIVQHLPELKKYTDLAEKLDKIRNKTEHSDTYFPPKNKIEALTQRAASLFKQTGALLKKLQSKEALMDLEAQRRLLKLFLKWLEEELSQYEQSHKSFFAREPPQDAIKNARKLLSLRSKVDEMTLDTINDHLGEVREAISEIDELSSALSIMMEEEAAQSMYPR